MLVLVWIETSNILKIPEFRPFMLVLVKIVWRSQGLDPQCLFLLKLSRSRGLDPRSLFWLVLSHPYTRSQGLDPWCLFWLKFS
jgi:hypothetical protein